MAGHSKWANIKHRKQSVDARKGAVYAQLSKEISVAARIGGTDPAFNFRLRSAIERAKQSGMPSDNIQRAVDKLKSSNQGNFEEILYEGYGPGGVAILVEGATNNRNRTACDLRLVFGKYEGNLGESGCVSWGFKHLGLIRLSKTQKIDENILLEFLDGLNLEDFDLEGDLEDYLLFTPLTELEASLAEVKRKYTCSAEMIYLPSNFIELKDASQAENLEKLLEKLEELDDVQKVFHNAIFPQS